MYVKVNKRMSQYGPFKALELEDGSKVNVSSKSKFYNVFDESGNYEVQVGTTQKGNATVTGAVKLDDNGSNLSNTAISKPTYTPAAKLAQNTVISQNLDKKIDFEKDKQKDIMIQCYIGRAIDMLTVNKHEEGFSIKDVAEITSDLISLHRSLAINADYKSVKHGHGEDILLTNKEQDDMKREEDLERVPEEKPTTQEDIPF